MADGRHFRRQHRTHGDLCCQAGVLVWPGDFRAVGLGGCLLLWWWLCSQLPGSCRRAVPGPAGAPAAWAPGRAPARTNELDVGKRRPMIGGEESACWLRGLLGRCRWLVPRCAWLAEWSHMHPSGACLWVVGAMTVPSGGRAAQSGHRARRGRLMRFCELARGWRPPFGVCKRALAGPGAGVAVVWDAV